MPSTTSYAPRLTIQLVFAWNCRFASLSWAFRAQIRPCDPTKNVCGDPRSPHAICKECADGSLAALPGKGERFSVSQARCGLCRSFMHHPTLRARVAPIEAQYHVMVKHLLGAKLDLKPEEAAHLQVFYFG